MNEDLFLKYLRKDLKPYVKESDCCEDIVELRKELEKLHSIIKEVREYIEELAEDNADYIGAIDRRRKVELLEILERANNDK